MSWDCDKLVLGYVTDDEESMEEKSSPPPKVKKCVKQCNCYGIKWGCGSPPI